MTTAADPPWVQTLREYQKELAEPGIRGLNYIICATTGSGKTMAAAYVVYHHLKIKGYVPKHHGVQHPCVSPKYICATHIIYIFPLIGYVLIPSLYYSSQSACSCALSLNKMRRALERTTATSPVHPSLTSDRLSLLCTLLINAVLSSEATSDIRLSCRCHVFNERHGNLFV